MPINPKGGSTISAGGNTLYVDDSQQEFDAFPFDRVEFDHDRLLSAPNTDGSRARVMEMLTGKRVQIGFNCGLSDTPRPLTPNDQGTSSDYDLVHIKRRFDIVRYSLSGLPSSPASVSAVASIAQTHRQLWAKFEARQAIASSAGTSYQKLFAMQSDTFASLTTTGFNISGSVCNANNLLIRQFNLTYPFSVPDGSGGHTIWNAWRMVVESLTDVYANS